MQTLDVQKPLTSVHSLTQLLCLRIRTFVHRVPEGIGKLTSLQELQIKYLCDEDEPLRQFVKDLGGLKQLRLLHLDMYRQSPCETDILMDMVESLCNLQRMDQLLLRNSGFYAVHANVDTTNLGSMGLPSPTDHPTTVSSMDKIPSGPIVLDQPLASSQPLPPVPVCGLFR